MFKKLFAQKRQSRVPDSEIEENMKLYW